MHSGGQLLADEDARRTNGVQTKGRAQRTLEHAERHYRMVKQGDALRAVIDAGCKLKNMTLADLAREIGMPTASALYNLRAGQSHSLSIRYTVAIGRVFGTNLTVLMGLAPVAAEDDVTALVLEATRARASPEIQAILHKMASRLLSTISDPAVQESPPVSRLEVLYQMDNGKPRRSQNLGEEREYITGVLSGREIARRAFGVRVIGGAGAPVYPKDTTLVCVPARRHLDDVIAGRRVLVRLREAQNRRLERLQLHEVRAMKNGQLRLQPLGEAADPAIEIPKSIKTDMWALGDGTVRVVGIVTSAIIPEA